MQTPSPLSKDGIPTIPSTESSESTEKSRNSSALTSESRTRKLAVFAVECQLDETDEYIQYSLTIRPHCASHPKIQTSRTFPVRVRKMIYRRSSVIWLSL